MRTTTRGLALALLLLAVACGAPGEPDQTTDRGQAGEVDPPAVIPLAKAPGWRDGLDSEHFALLEVAFLRENAEMAWADNVPDDLIDLSDRDGDPTEFGTYGDLADVDLSTHAVAVWSSGESGSCPEWLADVHTDEEGTVEFVRDQDGTVCTDDYNPYRMVLAIDLDRLPSPAQLPTESVAEIPSGPVTPYPAGP